MNTGILTRQEKTVIAIAHIVMILLTIFALAPFWLLVSSSLQSESSIIQEGYSFLPGDISTSAYTYISQEWAQIGKAYGVTILVTVAGTALSLILVSLTSYALSIKGLPGGKLIFTFATYITGDTGAAVNKKFSPERAAELGLRGGQHLLLERGGKHSSDVPNFSQMNLKQDEFGNKVTNAKGDGALPHNKLIFEIEYGISDEGDLTEYVREHGRMMKGKNQGLAKIQPNQYYDFKTNPNAVGNWGIGGTFRITRLVPYSEVVSATNQYKQDAIEEARRRYEAGEIRKADMNAQIKGAEAIQLQKWVGGYHPEDFGLTVENVNEMVQEGYGKKLTDAVTYDDAGNVIPLSERFNPDNPDLRYSAGTDEMTRAQLEQEYQEALDANDPDWQAQVVNQAAIAAGYVTGAYHGSPVKDITSFNTRSQDTKKQKLQLLFGTHFTQTKSYADIYAKKAVNSKGTSRMTSKTGRVYNAYLDLGKSLDLRTARNYTPGTEMYSLYEDLPANIKKKVKPFTFSAYDTAEGLGEGNFITASLIEDALQMMSPKEATDFLVDHGYNSVLYMANYNMGMANNRFGRDPSIIMLDPERIKSGDPITYDDNGNIIPLSERFNPTTNDIRYSAGTDEMTSAQLDAELEAMLTDEDFEELRRELFGDQDADEEETKTVLTNAVKDIKDEFDPTIYNGRLYVKPDTMNHWLSGSGFAAPKSPSYAQAYITSMNPADFLRMTTTTEEGQNRILSEARTLDRTDLEDNAKRQPIQLIIDEATGKVIGHEGRHRSVALARAGVTEMPVLLFDSATKNSKTPKAMMTLEGQNLNSTTTNGNMLTFTDVLPLSNRYRDQIFERYTATDAERQAAAQGQQSILEYSAGDMTEEQMEQELIDAGVITPDESMPQRQFGYVKAQQSPDLDQRVKDYLYTHSAYTPDSNRAQVDRAIEWIHQMADTSDPSGFRNALQSVADGTFDSRGADGQARLLVMMSLAATQGSISDQLMLADLYNKEGTTAGQQLQSRKLFRLMTPIGRIAVLKQEANRITDELSRKGVKTDIQLSDWTLQAAANAQSEEDFEKVRKAANQEIADQLPVSWKERLQSWRMLAMLANPRTHVRNFIGNALFVPAVGLKNKLGAAMELAKPAGQRTKTLSVMLPQDIKNFAIQDAANIKDVLTGEAKYSDRTAVQRNKQTLPGFLQAINEYNSGKLEAEDWFFLKGHYRRALGGWMQANGYTVAQMQANPGLLEQGRAYAVQEAQKATYRDANLLAKTLNEVSRKGGALGMFVDAVLPFKKTPANILKRGIEYSPVGLVKSLTADALHLTQYRDWQNGQYSKMPDKAISPNQWIDNLCSGLSGTAIFAVGAILSNMGIISIGLDDDDDEFDKLEGAQEYSVKIFGHTYTLDWAAPACMPFFVGAAVREQFTREGGFDIQEMLNAAANIAEPVFNLSMLDGVNSLFRTSQYDETNNLTQILAKVGTNYATSYWPSLFGAAARSFDPVRRKAFVKSGESGGVLGQIRYAVEQTENKILGVSRTNIPMRDAFGRTESDNIVEKLLENFVSPGYHTTMQNDPVVEELRSLYEATGNRSMIPKLPNKTLTVNKQSIALEAEQYDQLTEERGSTAYSIISDLMASSFYRDASEQDRAEMITDAWTYATQTANHSVDSGYKMDTWVQNSLRNPTRSILNRAKDRIDRDYKEGCKIAAVEAVESGDLDALDTALAKFEETGGKKSSIKTAVGNAYKEDYIRAYQEDDYATMDEIEALLEITDLGFSDNDFQKWIDSVENQIREDEEDN